MREIKFRAWLSESRKMLYHAENFNIKWCPEPEFETCDSFADVLNSRRIAVSQYTGLKDKNGKEIYEGDITNYGTVEWCECLGWEGGGSLHPGFYFKEGYEFNQRGELDYFTSFDEDIEVIGNIYENSELIRR